MKKYGITIRGMTCVSCEVLLERKLKSLAGVNMVKVNHRTGKATLYASQELHLEDLQNAVKDMDYKIESIQQSSLETSDEDNGRNTCVSGKNISKNTSNHYQISKNHLQIGAVFLIIMGGYFILKQFDLLPSGLIVSDNMSYGFIFVMGLVAAMSTCLAVTGGLLLAVAEKHRERYPHRTGIQKFAPHLYFNAGRILSYTVLGGAVGVLGSFLTLSPKVNGFLTIIASMVMIILGLQLLNIIPGLKRFMPKMPKFIAHKIMDNSHKEHKSTPFLLGAATFFLPCGFTQALQLYVLSTGDFVKGALVMLAFVLGTLPSLLSIGFISSFSKGKFHKYFVRFTAVLIIIMGVASIQSGLTLTGMVVGNVPNDILIEEDTGTKITGDVQIVEMAVKGLDYFPAQFILKKGVPVEWKIDGSGARGCAQILSVPKLGITERLFKDKITTIRFTPEQTGNMGFSCGMGMAGPGVFKII